MTNKDENLNFYHQLAPHPLRISRQDPHNIILEKLRKGTNRQTKEDTSGWRLIGYFPNIYWLLGTAETWIKTYPKYLKIKKSEQTPEFKKNMKGFKVQYEWGLQVADYFKGRDWKAIQKELDDAYNLANVDSNRGKKKRGRPKKTI